VPPQQAIMITIIITMGLYESWQKRNEYFPERLTFAKPSNVKFVAKILCMFILCLFVANIDTIS